MTITLRDCLLGGGVKDETFRGSDGCEDCEAIHYKILDFNEDTGKKAVMLVEDNKGGLVMPYI